MRQRFLLGGLLCIAGAFALLAPSPGRAQAPAPTTAPPATKTSEATSATISFRWIKPSEFVALLTQPLGQEDDNQRPVTLYSGLQRVSPDDATNRVFVQGTPKAVSQLQDIVPLFDVEPKRVRLTVRILRAPANQFALFAEPDQKLRKGEVVSTATAVFKNNQSLTLHAVADGQAFHIPLTPHINGDGSVSVAVDVSDLPESATSLGIVEPKKEAGKETSGEKRIRVRRVGDGVKFFVASKPYWKDNNFAYYLEITPAVLQRSENP